jgi:hypothetical protein
LLVLFLVLALGGAAPLGAEVYCKPAAKDPRVEMLPTKALPWGAVGYLDNGCTATLIDARHVLAAAHCFTDDDHADSTPGWQDAVYFVPNFHPSTATTATFHLVDRVVTGTRLNSFAPGYLDWGIGHLATAVTGVPALKLGDAPATVPFTVSSAGYGRDRNRVQPGGTRPAGPACGNDYCGGPQGGGNVWWRAALLDRACAARFTAFQGQEDWLFTDCASVGGHSGAPIVRALPGAGRTIEYRVVGVNRGGFGGVDTNDSDGDGDTKEAKPYSTAKVKPPCAALPSSPAPGVLNDGPAAQRFRYAPLFGKDVALVTAAGGVERSLVFVADADASRIVVRERAGAKIGDRFSTYRFDTFLLRPARLAGFSQPNGSPALAAIAREGSLFVRLARAQDDWPYWQALDLPPGVSALRDVDGLEHGAGELYVLGANGAPYARRQEGETWGPWRALGGSGYTSIAAVTAADGRRLLFFTKAGPNVFSVYWRRQTGSSWSSSFTGATAFGGSGFRAVGVDAVRDQAGVVHLLGIDGKTGLWERRTYGKPTTKESWAPWFAAAHLFVPVLADAAKQETTGPWLEGAVSLTATRWAEPGTSTVPGLAAFVVDKRGNVHETTLACPSGTSGSCYWRALRAFTE